MSPCVRCGKPTAVRCDACGEPRCGACTRPTLDPMLRVCHDGCGRASRMTFAGRFAVMFREACRQMRLGQDEVMDSVERRACQLDLFPQEVW